MKKLILLIFIISTYSAAPAASRVDSSNPLIKDINDAAHRISVINLDQAITEVEFQKTIKKFAKVRGNTLKFRYDKIYTKKSLRINAQRIKKVTYNGYISYTLLISGDSEGPFGNLMFEEKNGEVNAYFIEYSCKKEWVENYIAGSNKLFQGLIGAYKIKGKHKNQNDRNSNLDILIAIEQACNCIIYSPNDTCKCKKIRPVTLYLNQRDNTGFSEKCSSKAEPMVFSIPDNLLDQVYSGMSVAGFISPVGEPDYMKRIRKINDLLGIKVIGPAEIDIPLPPGVVAQQISKESYFVIEDALHADFISDKFTTYQQAYKELQEIDKIPWGKTINKLPCKHWKKCERRYQIVEYTSDRGKKKELNRKNVLVKSRSESKWE